MTVSSNHVCQTDPNINPRAADHGLRRAEIAEQAYEVAVEQFAKLAEQAREVRGQREELLAIVRRAIQTLEVVAPAASVLTDARAVVAKVEGK
jgi:hypothetical protein